MAMGGKGTQHDYHASAVCLSLALTRLSAHWSSRIALLDKGEIEEIMGNETKEKRRQEQG